MIQNNDYRNRNADLNWFL